MQCLLVTLCKPLCPFFFKNRQGSRRLRRLEYGSLGVKYSFTVELPPRGANPGFILPPSQIITTGEEIFEGMKALVTAMRI